MSDIMRLPALPLVVNDPYFSIWMPADLLTDSDSTHWAGAKKRLLGTLTIDGTAYRYLGAGSLPPMQTSAQTVSPMSTQTTLEAGNVALTLKFTTPLLLNAPDIMSTPATFIDFDIVSLDGAAHDVKLEFSFTDDICYDGDAHPDMMGGTYRVDDLQFVYCGQRRQKPLCHSGDHITIDWGYLYLTSDDGLSLTDGALKLERELTVEGQANANIRLIVGYDDIASINYFGQPTKAWYARNGKTLVQAMHELYAAHDALMARCGEFDASLTNEAIERGGPDYALICAAAYRHAIAAHKLIADENGKMVLLSKENDSNGCIGTVDVSYPSSPLFLKYNPELTRALCRGVLKFAKLPVWGFDFAPHDIGRYPYATGQVYGVKQALNGSVSGGHGTRIMNGDVYPPYYVYPAGTDCYEHKYQMPVEECGNMLIMLYAAAYFDGDYLMDTADMHLLTQWVQYLIRYGEDPGEQLCTDDFAGHLNRNINLSAKAIVGIACYAQMLKKQGDSTGATQYMEKAREMAKSWLECAGNGEYTYLTFDRDGWSQKYNLAWDRVLGLKLMPDSFYESEIKSYIGRINTYGLPLDSRKDYTKSDWILWCASMANSRQDFEALVAPIAKYIRETSTRVPFSDWYDTVTGKYEHFIARSVQGGVFMPLI